MVQSVLGGNNTGTITNIGQSLSCTANFPSNTTNGNFLMGLMFVHIVSSGASLGNLAFSSSGISWFANLQSNWAPAATGGNAILFYLPNASSVSSGTTVTFTVSQVAGGADSYTVNVECVLFEVSGVLTTNPIEFSSSRNLQTNAVPFAGRSVALINAALVVVLYNGDSGTNSAGANYTLGPALSLVDGGVQYWLNAAIGTQSLSFAGVTQGNWCGVAAAFKPVPAPTNLPFVFGAIIGA